MQLCSLLTLLGRFLLRAFQLLLVVRLDVFKFSLHLVSELVTLNLNLARVLVL